MLRTCWDLRVDNDVTEIYCNCASLPIHKHEHPFVLPQRRVALPATMTVRGSVQASPGKRVTGDLLTVLYRETSVHNNYLKQGGTTVMYQARHMTLPRKVMGHSPETNGHPG